MKRIFALFSIATFISVACGSSDNGNLDHPTCSPGDTRTCVGPAACNGGQVCGNDGNWGTCDCGNAGSGGTAGSGGVAGGSGGTGAAGGSGGGDASSAGGTGGSAGTGGVDSGAAGQGGTAGAGGDDPCQTPLTCDMTKTCDPSAPPCLQSMCHALSIAYNVPVPRAVRLPSHPADCCSSSGKFVAQFVVDEGGVLVARATVSPPWYVALTPGITDVCNPPSGSNCIIDTNDNFFVFTTDPDAPARNLLIESVPVGTTCP